MSFTIAAYQEKIKNIAAEKIAYVDECGIDTYLYREYGYAPRGQQVFGRISGRKYKRCGIVAAQMAGKVLAPFQYSGTMNSGLFEFWLRNLFSSFKGFTAPTVLGIRLR